MKKWLICLICFVLLLSCKEISPLERALHLAGTNRPELEKVLQHYEADELKYRAALFLIENMVYYTYRDGEWVDNYHQYYELGATKQYEVDEIYKIMSRREGLLPLHWQVKKDIEQIDSAYLVNNIEWAFKVWEEQPWGKNISFDMFCDMILPYRIADERLAVWREEVYTKYNPLLDAFRSSPDREDPSVAAKILIDTLETMPVFWTSRLPDGPHIGPAVVEWKSGSCRELADMLLYVFRALGIPCSLDYFPIYSNHNPGHFWVHVPDLKGNSYMNEFPDTRLRPATQLDAQTPKIFRKTFGLNHALSAWAGEDKKSIHPVFRYPCFEDVTTVYNDSLAWSIKLPASCLTEKVSPDELIYLSTAYYREWIPVAAGRFRQGEICFEEVQGNCVFWLGVLGGNGIKVVSDPFYLDFLTGEIRFINAEEELEEIVLFSKFKLEDWVKTRMIGGVFEGSNRPDFAIRDTLIYIEEKPRRQYNYFFPDSEKEYRYVRYFGPSNGHCNIAELYFYKDVAEATPLEGTIIGTPGAYDDNPQYEYTQVFDGNPATSFDYREPDGGWVGLDLGKPSRIRKIMYIPRNHENFIYPDEQYELFYFKDGKWLSLGKQVATADSLSYMAPAKGLYYLKNYTRGKDERIFEYHEGRQIFR